ncbi:MAG: hypothetical protein HYV19_09675 [Gemmatimonadetes bacterium]|nr:hypothetical protein [Gemmatimonadota bacterium]
MIPPGQAADGGFRAGWWALLLGALALVGAVVLILHPPHLLLASPFAREARAPAVSASPAVFGRSGQVRVQMVLPSERFDFPLEVRGDPGRLGYAWVRAQDSAVVTPSEQLFGATVVAPGFSGFYRLEVEGETGHQIVDSILVAVMVPYSAKIGQTINGYRIGNYRSGIDGEAPPPPRGFVEVTPASVELPVSTHMRLADFVTHDEQQDQWPKYVALDARVLDKVELVIAYVGAFRGGRNKTVNVDVHSGFRAPVYNRRVPRAARDSRHQYGDAADLAIDADGDGRVTWRDGMLVSLQVEQVERDFPQYVGGLGLYGNQNGVPYVHIDVRGKRARWKG